MLKVLFIDNDGVTRIAAKRIFDIHGKYKLLMAASGVEGIKMAFNEKPQLILLDLMMAVMDGIQTLKKLRDQGCYIPVIFVTAKDDVTELMQFADLGVVSIIKKPFVPSALLEECGKILENTD